MPTTETTIAVGRAALLRRVNRRLSACGKQLFKARGQARDAGPFYIVNLRGSCVTDSGVELETYARELKALAKWETLA